MQKAYVKQLIEKIRKYSEHLNERSGGFEHEYNMLRADINATIPEKTYKEACGVTCTEDQAIFGELFIEELDY